MELNSTCHVDGIYPLRHRKRWMRRGRLRDRCRGGTSSPLDRETCLKRQDEHRLKGPRLSFIWQLIQKTRTINIIPTFIQQPVRCSIGLWRLVVQDFSTCQKWTVKRIKPLIFRGELYSFELLVLGKPCNFGGARDDSYFPTTPLKFNMEPEKKSLEKVIPFGNHHFQVPC